MDEKIIIPQRKCKRCGHKWFLRTPEEPTLCPGCNSAYWNRERKKEGD